MAVVHPIPRHRELEAERLGVGSPAANDPRVHATADPLVPTVFHEPWWLDAATGGCWEAAEVTAAGRRIGWMPFVMSRHKGFRVSTMPRLAHVLGPVIDEGHGGANKRWLRRMDVLAELIGRLPRVALFSQTCHPDTTDLLGFQAQGFDSFVQFSAEVGVHAPPALWSALRDKTRNVIRRALEAGGCETVEDPLEFTRFYARNLERAGNRSHFDVGRITPLFEAAHRRGQARILGVRAAGRQLAAAVFYAWDARRMWYFLSTRDAAVATNGAVSLLVWEGMRLAADRGLVFDFDGIAGAGAARFYAGFGARIVPRFAVFRRSIPYALFTSALDAARGRTNRNVFVAP